MLAQAVGPERAGWIAERRIETEGGSLHQDGLQVGGRFAFQQGGDVVRGGRATGGEFDGLRGGLRPSHGSKVGVQFGRLTHQVLQHREGGSGVLVAAAAPVVSQKHGVIGIPGTHQAIGIRDASARPAAAAGTGVEVDREVLLEAAFADIGNDALRPGGHVLPESLFPLLAHGKVELRGAGELATFHFPVLPPVARSRIHDPRARLLARHHGIDRRSTSGPAFPVVLHGHVRPDPQVAHPVAITSGRTASLAQFHLRHRHPPPVEACRRAQGSRPDQFDPRRLLASVFEGLDEIPPEASAAFIAAHQK
jgi:hypothetical protein